MTCRDGHHRFAFVGLVSKASQGRAVALLNRETSPNHWQKAKPYTDALTGEVQPSSLELKKYPYLSPVDNSSQPQHPQCRKIFIGHLPPDTTSSAVVDLLEDEVGRNQVRFIKFLNSPEHPEAHAIVEFSNQRECRVAIRELDGVRFRGSAILVTWPLSSTACERHDERDSAPRASPPDSHRKPSLSSSNLEPLRGTNRYGRPTCGSPPFVIHLLQPLWEPYDKADSSSTSKRTQDLVETNRSMQVEVEYGFLPKEEAKKALEMTAKKPMFSDPVQELQFEAF
ncbi:hypothetical protein JCM8547_009421 [Rhodosporidiobolus lusitaniae]